MLKGTSSGERATLNCPVLLAPTYIGKNFGMGNFKPDNMPSKETTDTENNDNSKAKDFQKMNFGIAKVSEVDSIDAVVDFKVLSDEQ